jgi:hypothetical protein
VSRHNRDFGTLPLKAVESAHSAMLRYLPVELGKIAKQKVEL